MKTLIAKSKLIITLSALVAILPIQSFAFEIVQVSATHKEYGAAAIEARTERSSVRATKLYQDGSMNLREQGGYDRGLELQTGIFVPVTFTVSRNGQVLKTVTIDKMFSAVLIPAEELEQR